MHSNNKKRAVYIHITQWAFHQCFNNRKTFYESTFRWRLSLECLNCSLLKRKTHKIIYDLLVYGNFWIFYVYFFLVGSLLKAQKIPKHSLIFSLFLLSCTFAPLFGHVVNFAKVFNLCILNHKSTWQRFVLNQKHC